MQKDDYLNRWKSVEKTDIYKSLIPWIDEAKKTHTIGTCKAESKIASSMAPTVRKNTTGLLISPSHLASLPDPIRKNLKKIPSHYLFVIFNNYVYFIDPKRLKEIKYTQQMNLF